MPFVDYRLEEGVAVITLARPKANAIHQAMALEMAAAFARAESEARAIVWSSRQPRFFSAGFDVREVFAYSREQLAEFLAVFSRLQQDVLACPKPTVAALTGQTYAGGAILALSCDFRVMAAGAYGIALTEINIGVNVPDGIFHLLAAAVGAPTAQRMFLTGAPILADQALAMGAVHELAPEAEVEARAVKLASTLASKPAATYSRIKQTIYGATGRTRTGALLVDLDAWFTEEAEVFKLQLREKLTGGL
jgi:3,2-trans-enoyl-CoA isomerase